MITKENMFKNFINLCNRLKEELHPIPPSSRVGSLPYRHPKNYRKKVSGGGSVRTIHGGRKV